MDGETPQIFFIIMERKMAEERSGKNPVQSAERIFQVMEMLANGGEMGLMELSTALDLHKSTVHRLLMSLIMQSRMRRRRNICFLIRLSAWRERFWTAWIFCRWQSLTWSGCPI